MKKKFFLMLFLFLAAYSGVNAQKKLTVRGWLDYRTLTVVQEGPVISISITCIAPYDHTCFTTTVCKMEENVEIGNEVIVDLYENEEIVDSYSGKLTEYEEGEEESIIGLEIP